MSLAVIPGKKEWVDRKLHSTRIQWLKFVSTGSNHLVLPAVYLRLKEADLLPSIPEIVSEHLEKIYLLNQERNNSIIKQAEEMTGILEKSGIPVMFLKGLGNIVDGLYTTPGERMIQDIDILVSQDDWESAVTALRKEGYRSRKDFNPEIIAPRKHYPRLFRDDSTASIELHRIPVSKQYEEKFTTDEIWRQKVPARNMHSVFVMPDNHKIIHNFIHSQLEHQGHFYAGIFLRNLYDQLLLSKNVSPYETLLNWGMYPKKAAAYLEVMRTTFYPEDKQNKLNLIKTGFYPLRHKLFLKSGFLSSGMKIIVRIYKSFIRKPVLAITDKNLRNTLINNLGDKSWYRKQIRIYGRYFGY